MAEASFSGGAVLKTDRCNGIEAITQKICFSLDGKVEGRYGGMATVTWGRAQNSSACGRGEFTSREPWTRSVGAYGFISGGLGGTICYKCTPGGCNFDSARGCFTGRIGVTLGGAVIGGSFFADGSICGGWSAAGH